jgi:hypothetical protein
MKIINSNTEEGGYRSYIKKSPPETWGEYTKNVIKDLFSMRIDKGKTELQIREYLQGPPYNYSYARATEYIAYLRHYIKENVSIDAGERMRQRIEELERLASELKDKGDWKNYRELIKELNKMLGNYSPQRVDLTSNGDKFEIPTINIVLHKPEDNKGE